jgi:hypothetical protein
VTITDKGFVTCENLLGKSMFDATDPWAPFVLNAIKVGGVVVVVLIKEFRSRSLMLEDGVDNAGLECYAEFLSS